LVNNISGIGMKLCVIDFQELISQQFTLIHSVHSRNVKCTLGNVNYPLCVRNTQF